MMIAPARFASLLAVLGLVVACNNASAAEPATDAAALVKLLGHDSYKIRKQAERDLIDLGRGAKDALQAGLASDDPEIRRACAMIFPIAMEKELEAKIAAFLADKEGKQKHDLPGWERFNKLVGATAESRRLFVDMHRVADGLLDPQDKDPAAQAQKFQGRAMQLQQMMYGNADGIPVMVPAECIAKLLLVGTDAALPLNANAHNYVFSLLYQDSFRQAMTSGDRGEIMRKLLVGYMMTRTDQNSVNQILNLAMNYNFKEFVDVAAKAAQDKQGFAHNRGMAITVLARLGGKDQMPAIRKLLDDATEIGTYNTTLPNAGRIKVTTQIRDVALATLVRLSGQQLGDYSYDAFTNNPRLGVDPTQYFSPMYLGFSEAKKRDAAFAKWKDWEAKQMKN
jgi:hypothetical protein